MADRPYFQPAMPTSPNSPRPPHDDLLLYRTPNGDVRVEVRYEEETLWMPQARMAALFGVDKRTVSEHLKNIFASGELEEISVVRKIRTAAADGKKYLTAFYNLDAIISVGYRVNSVQATQFRIWATQTLKSYIIKGFVLDDARLKNGANWGEDYFEELLERIREIRASERRFYQKITDIYQRCSVDYDKAAPVTKTFFATVQNKLEWAITGKTAAELIADRADAAKPNMGLTTWKQAPKGKIRKADVSIAKNYLSQEELTELNRLVGMYLDFAELQAQRRIPMQMSDWVTRLDDFLAFNQYNVLKHAGKVAAEMAKTLAEKEFAAFEATQPENELSDFDKEVAKTLGAASNTPS
jgi:hypothetical protein